MNTPITPNKKPLINRMSVMVALLLALCITFLLTKGKNNSSFAHANDIVAKNNVRAFSSSIKEDNTKHNKHINKTHEVKNNNQDYADPSIVKKMLLKRGIYFGDYLNELDFVNDSKHPANYLNIISRYFDIYTIPAFPTHIESKGKGIFNFSGVDLVADFAIQHGALIHGHNMVKPLPSWLTNGNYPPDTLKAILKEYIQTTLRHYIQKYGNAVRDWDVINESISDGQVLNPRVDYPDGTKKVLWSVIHRPGSNDPLDFIRYAFEWAHEAAPNVKLYWNEYNVEYKGYKMDRWFNIVKQLKAEGVPIDGVGFQTHINMAYEHSLDELRQNMDRFANIGLESHISEADVMMAASRLTAPNFHPAFLHSTVKNSPTEADFQQQAEIYRGIIDAALSAKKCTALILWGAWDPASWTDQTFRKPNGAVMVKFYSDILDDNMNPKLAYKTMAQEVYYRIGN